MRVCINSGGGGGGGGACQSVAVAIENENENEREKPNEKGHSSSDYHCTNRADYMAVPGESSNGSGRVIRQ